MNRTRLEHLYMAIGRLLDYGVARDLMSPLDRIYSANRLFKVLGIQGKMLDVPSSLPPASQIELTTIMAPIMDWALESGLLESNSADFADLLDAELMGCLMGRPSETISMFEKLYEGKPERATTYLYQQGQASNYIRMDRIAKNVEWRHKCDYGDLDITINLSKPEKDPKAIAAAKMVEQGAGEKYPACLLCKENEGYGGRLDHPARQNLRLIPLVLNKENWYLQYSPYVYYNEHCIVLSEGHIPMKLSKDTYQRLVDFVDLFPSYFIGSNADLPIVGGSILTHDHYQGGGYEFAMARSEVEQAYELSGWDGVAVGRVKWPMSVIRISGEHKAQLVELAWEIHQIWQGYSDLEAELLCESHGALHNTITPIARVRRGQFEIDLVLRNNRVSEVNPDGIFHPHQELHHIKKENIGLIEVMGLAVLPGRLEMELKQLESKLKARAPREAVDSDDQLSKHGDWYEALLKKSDGLQESELHQLILDEVGRKFEGVLEHAGIFKRTTAGFTQFDRFMDYLSKKVRTSSCC